MLRLPDPETPRDEATADESRSAPGPRQPVRRQTRRQPGAEEAAKGRVRTAKPLAAVPSPTGSTAAVELGRSEPHPLREGAASNPLFKAIDGGLSASTEGRGKQSRPSTTGSRARSTSAPRRQAARLRDTGAAGDGGGVRPECYACPVGIAFGTVRGASPETLDHLMAASRELVAAARTVMEALEANLERHGRAGQLQRIDLE